MTERLAYSVAEAAEAIGISTDTVYRLIQSGELRSIQVGKRRLVSRAALLDLLGVPPSQAVGWDAATFASSEAATSAPPLRLLPLGEDEATFLVTIKRVPWTTYAGKAHDV